MSSERAGVHTGRTLNREKAQEVIANAIAFEDTYEAILDRLEVCVVPDPRLTRIEALCNAAAQELADDPQDVGAIVNDMALEAVRAVLRGEWG